MQLLGLWGAKEKEGGPALRASMLINPQARSAPVRCQLWCPFGTRSVTAPVPVRCPFGASFGARSVPNHLIVEPHLSVPHHLTAIRHQAQGRIQ